MTYQAFRAEAEEFLINYKKSHPSLTRPISVEDLIVLSKPNIEAFKENLNRFNKAHGDKYTEEIHCLDSHKLDSSVKFLVPSNP